MRLFIAVNLPPDLLDRAGAYSSALQAVLRDFSSALRWVEARQYHITLKFLGETDPARVKALETALGAAGRSRAAFRVVLSEAALGPSGGAPKTLWLRVTQGQDALAEAAETMDRACQSLGHLAEARRFTPHVTLARIKKPLGRDALEEAMRRVPAPAFPAFSATGFCLVRSRLHAAGADYETLSEFPFAAASH